MTDVTVTFRLEKKEFTRASRQVFYARKKLMIFLLVAAVFCLADAVDDGIHLKTPLVDSRFTWSAYTGMTEAGGLFMFRRNRLIASIVPRRAFASPGDESTFRQLVARHLGANLSPAPAAPQ